MIKISGVGDLFLADKMPENGYEGFDEICSILNKHDIKFANLETTIHNNEGYPSRFPGGGYAMASPDVLQDIKRFGINLLNLANNHAGDYSHKGLEATIGYLNNAHFKFAGAGMNLAEASSPVYIECAEGRVGLVAAASSFHDSDAAGPQSENMPGRPGVNPVSHTEVYQLTEDLFEAVKIISEKTGINDFRNNGAKNGFLLPNEYVKLLNLNFALGDETKKISFPCEKDVTRICDSIKEAKRQADCVIFSFHGHQLKGNDEVPDDFIVELCHKAAEAGADIIFCHGAHILRGIEIYNGVIIFYSLADFIMKNELELKMPADFMDMYRVPPPARNFPGYAFDIRSHNSEIGMSADPYVWESIIASIEFDSSVKNVKLYPITLHFEYPRSRRGWPSPAGGALGNKILGRLQSLSKPYGTDIMIENGVGIINMK